MNNKEQELSILIRDLTKVGSISKSEARRRILELLAQTKQDYEVLVNTTLDTKNREIAQAKEEGYNKCLKEASESIGQYDEGHHSGYQLGIENTLSELEERLKHIAMYHDSPNNMPCYSVADVLEVLSELKLK